VGRPEADELRSLAMNLLGCGLSQAKRHNEALSVQEAELAIMRRLGVSEDVILVTQSNLARTYHLLGRRDEALLLRREVYSGFLKLLGEEHSSTLTSANNYGESLVNLGRFEEAKALLRKTVPVARRVLGEDHELTLMMRKIYAGALCKGGRATFNDLREAVRTYEDTKRIARRVLGGAHPLTVDIENNLRCARAHEELFRAHATGDMSSLREALAAMPPPGSA
jgi:tetratricopeptide (TPR) repeat protein